MNVAFISLGCDKNLSDSEHMLFLCRKAGIKITSEDEADVIVVNTCCFIETALEESIQNIIEAGKLKETGKLSGLVVCGCMSERYAEDIRRDLPEVDAIVGTNSYDEIVSAIESAYGKEKLEIVKAQDGLPDDTVGRVTSTGLPYDYLKIAEGCDKRCTYCIIPSLRGNYRSVPMEKVLEEAKQLAENGITEIDIVAQETTLYGTDIYGEKKLPELLHKICEIDGIKWVRVLYCYPEEINEELIQTIKNEPKICHYLDLPIQSGSDSILKRMGRKTNNAEIRELVKHLREEIPDICLRTTLISGFPGETAKDHNETMKLVEDLRFDRLGVFTYSQEEDTPAATMPDQVSERVKTTRRNKLMKLQQKIAFEGADSMVGKTVDVIIEGKIVDEEASSLDGFTYVGRTYKDAPDIDGYVFVSGVQKDLMSGAILKVLITGSNEYDLVGEEAETYEFTE